MAGDWIKMRIDLADDPAVIAMACALDIDEFGIVGRLHKLWSWADKHCSSGHAKSVTNVWIDRYIGHAGFAQSMIDAGWLAVTDSGIEFPKFDKHNGSSAKVRAEAAERKRVERMEKERLAREMEEDARRAAAGQMSQENCDKSVTREEKRREELPSTTTSNEVVVGDYAANAPRVAVKPDCPHQAIIALYHEVLPMCPQVRDWTPSRAQQLRARWNEDESRQNLDYWRRFFEYVKTCGFLIGHQPSPQRRPFFADLEWLTKSANFTKIRERKYE
jgi:hypothetical protein